jgi:hypothetical protein
LSLVPFVPSAIQITRSFNLKINLKKIPLKKTLVFSFFLIYLITGYLIYPDFGISWDEPQSRLNGEVNLKYVIQQLAPSWSIGRFINTPSLLEWVDKDYGVAFELPLYILEKFVQPHDDRSAFLLRHLVTFLFSTLGPLCLYKIISTRYQDWRLGILAASLLILTPRFFGESFYNSKDIVFMAAYLMAFCTLYVYLNQPSLKNVILHSFATAFATDIRIIGCSILLLTLFATYWAPHTLNASSGNRPLKRWGLSSQLVKLNFIYLLCTASLIVAMFPLLWDSPIENFINSFKGMANFRWDQNVLYLGDSISAQKLPWHYIPTWIFITVPPMYLVLFVLGVINSLWNLSKIANKKKLSGNDVFDGLVLIIFFGPILSGIFLQSTFYDGWRQMYFVYPFLLILSIRGFSSVCLVLKDFRCRSIFLFACAFGLAHNTYIIFETHPLQNLYFNQLAGKNWRKSFDVDYWGLANKSALQHILDHDSRTHIKVTAASGTPLWLSLGMVDPTQSHRIAIVDEKSRANYIVQNYRWTDGNDEQHLNTHAIFHQIKVMNEVVLTIYKMMD